VAMGRLRFQAKQDVYFVSMNDSATPTPCKAL
jgi:hypothetical protein